MKAEHHLATRTPVHEKQRRTSRGASTWNKKLSMNLKPIFSRESDLLGDDELRGRKLRGKLGRGNHLASGWCEAIGHCRRGCSRAEAHDGAAIREFGGRPFHRLTLAKSLWLAPIHTHAPQMTAIEVVLVRGVNYRSPVVRYRHILHFKFARSEKRGGAAGSGNRVQMIPAILLRSKDDATASEVERFAFGEIGKRAGEFFRAVPDGTRFTS